MITLQWEQIDNYHQRAKIFGGWLVKAFADVSHQTIDRGMCQDFDWRIAICFVPDPKHEWKSDDNCIS